MDNRLIHGQVLVAWNAEYSIDHIIVTNDEVAADPLQVMLLKAVAPLGVRVSVLPIEACVACCNSQAAAEEGIFIIAKTPEDGLSLVQAGLQVSGLNLGNQGFVRGSKPLSGSNSVYLTESGCRALQRLHVMGVRITCRMMPDDPERDAWAAIERSMPEWAI